MSSKPRVISEASAKWDIDGDGQLDEAEMALKKIDKEGNGQLTKEELHALMKEHLSTQRELWSLKKMAMGLACLVLILALGMLGTSFAAAILAKDTANRGDDFVDSSSGKTLGMQTSSERFEGDEDGESTCMLSASSEENKTMCSTSSLAKIDLAHGKAMVEDCSKDRTVHLTHIFASGREMHHALCPIQEGFTAIFDTNVEYPTASISTSGGFIVIEPNAERSYYVISGDGITSDAGYPCDSDLNCDNSLVCNVQNHCESAGSSGGEE